jgi:endonuclease YncB( thermonuclease family)
LYRLRGNRWVVLGGLIVLLAVLQWFQEPARHSGQPVPTDGVKGRPQLVDGDSFHLAGEEVRLVGIDAPEGPQTCTRGGATWPCGEESRRHLQRLIAGRTVECVAPERDQHGRLLARCTAGEHDLNREMVASGLAVAYGDYQREETGARAAKRGLWSGEFERPRDWRRNQGSRRD